MKRLMNSMLGNRIYLTNVKPVKDRPNLFVAHGKKEDYTDEAIKAVFEWFINNYKASEPNEAYEIKYEGCDYVLRMVKENKDEKMKVKIVNKSGFDLPRYETKGAAAFDIQAKLDTDKVILKPGKQINFETGLYIAVPEGYELQVRGRSGNAMNYGISVTHGVGTIDSDYRGEIKIFITNHGEKDFEIKNGDRIAQGIVAPIEQVEWEEVAELDKTERGENGFGSTGRR
jgi:dUTP pyrophosphatase